MYLDLFFAIFSPENGTKWELLSYTVLYCPIKGDTVTLSPIMSSTIRVKKTCEFCKKVFIARTTVTKYCSDTCSKKGYKKRKRDEKVLKVEIEEAERTFNPILGAKSFLNMDETAELLGVSRKTIYRMIKRGELKGKKLGRRVVIARKEIDGFFTED